MNEGPAGGRSPEASNEAPERYLRLERRRAINLRVGAAIDTPIGARKLDWCDGRHVLLLLVKVAREQVSVTRTVPPFGYRRD